MKLKLPITLIFLLGSVLCIAQSETQTRAVVVGVSEYQDTLIPNLQYAHRDANAFSNWLLSSSGGSVPAANIKMHTDSTATVYQIAASIGWLKQESKPGDKAYIYLSGHGDVERVTNQNGYFLGFDSHPVSYGIGGYPLEYLKVIINEMTKNDVQVFMFFDACRAGKLSGSGIDGSQITAKMVTQQFENTVKMLSCEPEEKSAEGDQWGAGRGAFSYHLENALYGLADADENYEITLREIENYLSSRVSEEVKPSQQNPMAVGSKKTVVAYVVDSMLTKIQADLKNEVPEFKPFATRSLNAFDLEGVDEATIQLYRQFEGALKAKQLMKPKDESANDYYEQLMAVNSIQHLHGDIQRDFAVALLNEGQQIINKIMQTDPQMIDNIWADRIEYDHLPEYYGRAGEILGTDHYIYNNIKAKEKYFKAKTYRRENYPNETHEWRVAQQIQTLNEAIALDSNIAILYYDLGNKYPYTDSRSIDNYKKANEISPNWTWGQYILGSYYHNLGLIKKEPAMSRQTIPHMEKAIRFDSTFLMAYSGLGLAYENLQMLDSTNYWRSRFVDKSAVRINKDPAAVTAYECAEVGRNMHMLKRYEEALRILLMGEALSGGKMYSIYRNLGVVLVDMQEFSKAIDAHDKLKTLFFPEEYCDGFNGAIAFNFLHDNKKAKKYFSKMKRPGDEEMQGFKLEYYFQTEKYSKAIHLADKCLKLRDNPFPYEYRNQHFFNFYIAESYLKLKKNEKANAAYQTIVDNSDANDLSTNGVRRPDYVYQAIALHRLGKEDAVSKQLLDIPTARTKDKWFHFNWALIYAQTDQKEEAIASLEKAVDLGWEPNSITWLHGSLCDHLLNPIRESAEYKAFVEQHFPAFLKIATRVPVKGDV